jgi:hypothetical protein
MAARPRDHQGHAHGHAGHSRPAPRTEHASCSEALINDAADHSFASAFAAAAASSPSGVDTSRAPPRTRRVASPMRAAIGRALPIWYSLPSLESFRLVRAAVGDACQRAHKPFDFAPMRPGRIATYKYETEAAYYEQYAKSLFAITAPRAGLDCLRHYEILASGAVPFFVDSAALDHAPLSMFAFPRELVRAAAALPGVPSEENVAAALKTDGELRVNRSAFPWASYCELRAKLLAHTEAYLTTTTLARYVLEQMARANPAALAPRRAHAAGAEAPPTARPPALSTARVLIVSSKGVSGDTWQNAFLYHGLVLLLGGRLSSWFGRKDVLFADFVYPHRFCCCTLRGPPNHQSTHPTVAFERVLSAPGWSALGWRAEQTAAATPTRARCPHRRCTASVAATMLTRY